MIDTDYITKESALSCLRDWIDRHGHEHTADEMVEYQRIGDLPVADVLSEERCKDCKYYTERKLLGPTTFCFCCQVGTGTEHRRR